jgi:hypothetical protein
MSNKLSVLEKSLILSYLLNKQAIYNRELAVHELKVLNDPSAGQLQSKFEKLLNASRKAFDTVEKNIEDKEELIQDLETTLNNHWQFIEQ